jgi:ABC-2 type transport system permease protein
VTAVESRPPSALGIFAFLLRRTTANMVRRRLKRLREPRYVIGVVIGAVYVYLTALRPLMRGRSGRTSSLPDVLSPEVAGVALLLSSLGLSIVAVVAWLFLKGAPRLDLKEADVQFLLPAPLTQRSVIHFSLLRSQLGLIFSSLIVGFFFGRGISPHFWQRVGVSWIVFSTLRLHAMGLAFSKAGWNEMAPSRSRLLRFGSTTLVILFAVAVLGWVIDGVRQAAALTAGANMSGYRDVMGAVLPALGSTALAAWSDGLVPRVLLAPFSALLAPAFAGTPEPFLWKLSGAFAVLLLHYFWVVRVSVRYEEAAMAGAQRSAQRAMLRDRGQLARPAAPSQREIVPFRLVASGIPEVAIVWKNLLSRSRFRLRSTALGLLAFWALLFIICAAGGASPGGSALSFVVAMILAVLVPILTIALPIGLRIDFRSDLERAAVLRGWPISSTRLVAAELATPLIVCVIWIWGVLGGLLAVLGGRHFALMGQASEGLKAASLSGTGFANQLLTYGIPGAFALALFLPALVSAALVIQNAAVLAWPDWFPPGQKRARGLEATGSRVLSMLGTLLIAVVGLLPAVLVGALVAWVLWGVLGAWAIVPAALFASVPVWAEAFAGTLLLARLFESFDISKEALE